MIEDGGKSKGAIRREGPSSGPEGNFLSATATVSAAEKALGRSKVPRVFCPVFCGNHIFYPFVTPSLFSSLGLPTSYLLLLLFLLILKVKSFFFK